MTEDRELPTNGTDEDAATRLLRLAGPRASVPATRAARVRAAVHAEWQRGVRGRAVRRRRVITSALVAAAAAVLLVIGWSTLVDRRAPSGDGHVAVVEQIEGIAQHMSGASERAAAEALVRGAAVRRGDWIETDARARLALRFADGTSVRLDVDSRVRPLSASAVELSAGAVYVDTGQESGRFEIRTSLATAHDIGTQFEVRLLDGTLRLRVRSGLVDLRDPVQSVSAPERTEIVWSASGTSRRPIAPWGPEWDWTARVSPPVEIEGMSLAAFLEHLAREHGWAIHYADATLASEAARIILHGSVEGLPAEDAVEVAMTTSGLRHRLEDGELLVLRNAEAR